MDEFTRPKRPQQNSMDGFGPAPRPRPNQNSSLRPMQDFSPKPQPNRQPAPQNRPTTPHSPSVQPAPRSIHHKPTQGHNFKAPRQQTATTAPQEFSLEPPTKNKNKFSKRKKALLVLAIAAVLIIGGFAFVSSSSDSNKSAATTKKSGPSKKPLEKPTFTTYYPSPMPEGLNTTKGSITYYKDSFTFIIEQKGQKIFFIYEQPASTDPNFASLKSKLVAPNDFKLSLGSGVEGNFESGRITAVKTNKNTILMVNCVNTTCGTISKELLKNMQENNDLENLSKSNS